METAQIIEGIQADVTALAAVGDEAAASVASRIAAAMGPPLRVRLIEALTEAAAELGPQLPDGRVEVRLVAASCATELSFLPHTKAIASAQRRHSPTTSLLLAFATSCGKRCRFLRRTLI